MPALYLVSVDNIALVAATPKTLIELATGAKRIRIVDWSVTFDGTSGSATPVKLEVGRFSAAITTGTSVTPDKFELADGAALVTAKHSATVEGAGTPSGVLIYRVPPTGGIVMPAPLGRELVVPTSGFWRIRANATCHVVFEE
jgi:hypothetical protein